MYKKITEAIIIILAIVIQVAIVIYDLSTYGTITGRSLIPIFCLLLPLLVKQGILTVKMGFEEDDKNDNTL